MSYLMCYIIWSHGFGLCLDLVTRVDSLHLLSIGHLLHILIPLEEPPHLTADVVQHGANLQAWHSCNWHVAGPTAGRDAINIGGIRSRG